MFVIGIPTLNEADNISRLVKQIDEYAVNLGKEIIGFLIFVLSLKDKNT